MAFKFFVILALVTVACAGVLPAPQVYHPAPVPATVVKTLTPISYAHGQPVVTKHEAAYNPNPQYNFAYEVHDEQTGDIKRHTEERDGDVVHGEYSLFDADGYRRVVQYTVDPHSGFNAVVNRIPLENSKTIVKQVTPVAYVAPAHPITSILKQYPTPFSYQPHN